jgi:ribosomal protein S18 acetylase RimI-like enzyme
MFKSWFMPRIKPLAPSQWRTLRRARLKALSASPDVFLSSYEQEFVFKKERWIEEFARGDWNIARTATNRIVSLLGCTKDVSTPAARFFLEYLWVDPQWRGRGLGQAMIGAALEQLRLAGVGTVFLWVLDGNDDAVGLYKRVGFVNGDVSQPIPGKPGRTEELMRLDLG